MTEMEESPIGYVPDYPHLAGKEERESTVQPGFRTDARGRIVDDMGRPCAGAHRNLLKQIGGDQVRPFDVTDAEAPDGGAALTKWIEACRSKFPPPPGSFTGEPSIPFECGARFFLTRWICRWLGPAWMNVGTCDDGTRLSQCSRCQGCSTAQLNDYARRKVWA